MLSMQLGGTEAPAAQRGIPKPFVFGVPATAVITPHELLYLILVTTWAVHTAKISMHGLGNR